MAAVLHFYSTEDWKFVFVSATSLLGMGLRAETRTEPFAKVIADATVANGRINVSLDGLTATVTSFADDRPTWKPTVVTTVICDLMSYDLATPPKATKAVGRKEASITPGVTLASDPEDDTLSPPIVADPLLVFF